MPRNFHGGKGSKKYANKAQDLGNITVNEKDVDQVYGVVDKMLGDRRLLVTCYEIDDKGEEYTKQRMCKIRGKMRKKCWINPNDLVLVSNRTDCSQSIKEAYGDIIEKYTPEQVRKLRKMNELPNSIITKMAGVSNNSNEIKEEVDDSVIFENVSDEEEANIDGKRANIAIAQQPVYGMPSSDESDEEYEEEYEEIITTRNNKKNNSASTKDEFNIDDI